VGVWCVCGVGVRRGVAWCVRSQVVVYVNIRTDAVSSCGPGAALSTLVTTFSPSPILHKKLSLFACAMRTRDFIAL